MSTTVRRPPALLSWRRGGALAALAALIVAAGCTTVGHPVTAPPPPPSPSAPPVPDLPGATASIDRAGAGAVTVASAERIELAGPIATSTVALTVRNADPGAAEAHVALTLPPGAIVGRLALDVDGRWMEGEVMPVAAASRIYDGIVHPTAGPRRDPARLVARGGGVWALDVFPVPGGGQRHVEIVYHRLIGAAPGTGRLEALPPSMAGPGYAFAVTPAFDRPVGGGPPTTVVIALDTSLSLGKAGLADAVAAARRVLAVRPDARLVTGDLRPRACAGPVAACLAAVDAGGGSDLGALLAEAARVAGPGPAAIVLISDGRATVGASGAALTDAVDDQARATPVAVHTVAVGPARAAVLARLAAVGQGSADGDVATALAGPRRPRFEVAGAVDVEVAPTARGLVVLGRIATMPSRLDVVRTDDDGVARATVDLSPTLAPGFAVARTLGARVIAGSPERAPADARAWGIATDDAAMLALETDDDYASRGVARYKAVERARELGQPPPAITGAAAAADRALMLDGDGDGVPDRGDGCPAEPETWNGKDDDDGCPDRAVVVIEQQQLRILDQVYFERGRAVIAPRAAPLLDEVARVMRDVPELTVVAVEGHRDAGEPARGGIGLRRAEAVRHALIVRGVEPARLIAVDLGAAYPLRPGRSADDRAYNRRVGWRILVVGGEVIDGATGLLAEHAEALRRTGRSSWRLDAALARAALARHDMTTAAEALVRALRAAPDDATRLAIFAPDVAAAWPDDYLTLVRATASSGVTPPDADADRYYVALTGASLATDPAAPLYRRAVLAWLAPLADADVRRRTSPARLDASATVLAWLGRTADAERRRSELAELRELAAAP